MACSGEQIHKDKQSKTIKEPLCVNKVDSCLHPDESAFDLVS